MNHQPMVSKKHEFIYKLSKQKNIFMFIDSQLMRLVSLRDFPSSSGECESLRALFVRQQQQHIAFWSGPFLVREPRETNMWGMRWSLDHFLLFFNVEGGCKWRRTNHWSLQEKKLFEDSKTGKCSVAMILGVSLSMVMVSNYHKWSFFHSSQGSSTPATISTWSVG